MLPLFCAVCGMIYHFLLPEGGVARTAKTVMSVLMLCALCTLLFRAFDFLDFSDSDSRIFADFGERDTTFPESLLRQTVADEVSGLCGAIVKKYTNVPHQIAADVHIGEEGVIQIERIRITFDAPPDGREALVREITEECGIIPEIRVEHENG